MNPVSLLKGDFFNLELQTSNLSWYLRKILANHSQLPDDETRTTMRFEFMLKLEAHLKEMDESWSDGEEKGKFHTTMRTPKEHLVLRCEKKVLYSSSWKQKSLAKREERAMSMANINKFNHLNHGFYPMKDLWWDGWQNRTAANALLTAASDHDPVLQLMIRYWALPSALQGMGLMKTVFSTAIVASYCTERQQMIKIHHAFLPTVLLTDGFWAVTKQIVDATRYVPELTELYWCPAVLAGEKIAWTHAIIDPPEASNLIWTPASMRAEMRYIQCYSYGYDSGPHVPHFYGRMLHGMEQWVATEMKKVATIVTQRFMHVDRRLIKTMQDNWEKTVPFLMCELALEMKDELDADFFAPLIKSVPYHSRWGKTRLPVLSLRQLKEHPKLKDNELNRTNQIRVFIAFLVDLVRDLGLPLVIALDKVSDPINDSIGMDRCAPAVTAMHVCRINNVDGVHPTDWPYTWPTKEWSWPSDVLGMGSAPIFMEDQEKGHLWFYPQPKHRSFAIPPELIERTINTKTIDWVSYQDVMRCVKTVPEQESVPLPLVQYLSRIPLDDDDLEPKRKKARLETLLTSEYPCTHCASHQAKMMHPERPLELFCNSHCYDAYCGRGFDSH